MRMIYVFLIKFLIALDSMLDLSIVIFTLPLPPPSGAKQS